MTNLNPTIEKDIRDSETMSYDEVEEKYGYSRATIAKYRKALGIITIRKITKPTKLTKLNSPVQFSSPPPVMRPSPKRDLPTTTELEEFLRNEDGIDNTKLLSRMFKDAKNIDRVLFAIKRWREAKP